MNEMNILLVDDDHIVNFLSKTVSEYLLLLESNNINIDYKKEINNLNDICKKIITH